MHFLQSKNGNRWITEPNVSHPCKLDNHGLFSSLKKKKCLCTKRFALSLCRALSFTWPAATVIYQNKEKRNVFIRKEKKKVCWNINRVAVVLFLNTIMAEVTSCKYRYIVFEMVVDLDIRGENCVLCANFFKHYRNRKYIKFPHHCQTILFHLASVNWSSHPFIGSSPSLMMALFLMCLIGFSGTALLAFKKSRDKPLGYTVLATGDHE